MDFLFCTNRKRVLMTGFAPFKPYKTNPSWVGVQAMNRAAIQIKHDIKLIRVEVPVSYNEVDQLIPRLWKKYQPDVSTYVHKIILSRYR